MVAGGHHLQRPPGTGDPREALSAARPRQQPEVDLGQPAAGARDGDPVVGAQRHLEPAPERGPVDRGHDRLRRALHHLLHLEQAGPPRPATELRDVGAGDERATTADEHDGRGRRIGDGGLEPFEQAVAHVEAQRVDRRRIEGDDGDIAVESEVGDLVDSGHERSRLIGAELIRRQLLRPGRQSNRPTVAEPGGRLRGATPGGPPPRRRPHAQRHLRRPDHRHRRKRVPQRSRRPELRLRLPRRRAGTAHRWRALNLVGVFPQAIWPTRTIFTIAATSSDSYSDLWINPQGQIWLIGARSPAVTNLTTVSLDNLSFRPNASP